MKSFLLFCSVAACFVASGVAQEDLEKKYANFDIEAVLNSKRLVTNYINCLNDKGPCSPEGADLKKTLPTVLKTLCEKCTPTQREKTVMVIQRLKKDYPTEWSSLMAKWDPTGEYKEKFTAKYPDLKVD